MLTKRQRQCTGSLGEYLRSRRVGGRLRHAHVGSHEDVTRHSAPLHRESRKGMTVMCGFMAASVFVQGAPGGWEDGGKKWALGEYRGLGGRAIRCCFCQGTRERAESTGL